MWVMALASNRFFRDSFVGGNTNNFSSLKELVVSTGGDAYAVLYGIGIIFCLIAIVLGGFNLALASKSKGYDETKKRLTRVAVIMIVFSAIVGITLMIANAFTW